MKKRFLFIADIIELKSSSNKLFKGCMLKKASKSQISVIREFIDQYISITTPTIKFNKYESILKKNKDDSYTHTPTKNSTLWKYYIIEHDSQSQYLKELQEVFFLCSFNLTIAFETINHPSLSSGRGYTYDIERVINFYVDTSFDTNVKVITDKEMEEFRIIKESIERLDRVKFQNIDKALKDFVQIRDIPDKSPFKILSCISILELLLTTNKSGSEKSLTYQLQKKINLINNQLTRKIDIHSYFGKLANTTSLETVIGLLYDYRSAIAHGSKPDFNKALSMFNKSQNKILPFLLNVIRSVLKFSIDNPQLITDIKEC